MLVVDEAMVQKDIVRRPRFMRNFLVLIVAVTATGCASSKISMVGMPEPISHPVSRIAMSPEAGVVGEAISIELFKRGIDIQSMSDSEEMQVRDDNGITSVIGSSNLEIFRENGTDALLSVRHVLGYDDAPDLVAIRLTSTHTGKTILVMSWENGTCGVKGSPCDRDMRKSLVEAAREIADRLSATLGSLRP
jgi:hypothetical protein